LTSFNVTVSTPVSLPPRYIRSGPLVPQLAF
jgi:hypothetical protein